MAADAAAPVTVRLAAEDDVDAALACIAQALSRGVPPERLNWHGHPPAQQDLFGGDAPAVEWTTAPAAPRQPWLPAGALALLRQVLLHDEPQRFQRAHRFAQRLVAEPRAWHDRLHPERIELERMAREVRREIHKMHAFVRFRPVADGRGGARHVAWFEPGHWVVRAAAPFFQRRFASMAWAILTPRGSVQWDGRALQFGPAAQRDDAPAADDGEALWLAYYRSIFNPARTHAPQLRREMPVRFWRNLPEAAAIAPLLRDAPERAAAMARHAADTVRRLPRASVPAAAPGGATGWRELAARARDCSACPREGRAEQVVFGRGAARASLMLVGEQPGDEEDRRGRPFVGPAGQWLQQALAHLQWPLDRLYVTNAVKHFHHTLRGRRRLHKTPDQQAVAACLDWLEAEIAATDPPVIVALGATAAAALLGDDAPPPGAGARVRRGDGRMVHVLPHPASLLRAGVGLQHPQALAWRARLSQAWDDVPPDRRA